MARPAVSRRALLTSAGAVTLGGSLTQAVTGCRFDPASSGSTAPPTAGPSSATGTTAADGDTAIVASARAALSRLVAHLLAGVTGADTALVAFHTAQLKALGGAAPTSTRRRLTPAALVALERRTQRSFVRWAEVCQSGELARVLAAVAAGIGTLPAVREAAA